MTILPSLVCRLTTSGIARGQRAERRCGESSGGGGCDERAAIDAHETSFRGPLEEILSACYFAFARSAMRCTSAVAATAGANGLMSPPMAAIWRTSVAVMWRTSGRGGEINGADFRRHHAVHAGHLHLVVEIGAVAQAAHHDFRAVVAGRLHGEAGEGHDLQLAALRLQQIAAGLLDEIGALLDREDRRLAGMDADADDQPVADDGRLADDVDMAVGERVERAGVDGDAHGQIRLAVSDLGVGGRQRQVSLRRPRPSHPRLPRPPRARRTRPSHLLPC